MKPRNVDLTTLMRHILALCGAVYISFPLSFPPFSFFPFFPFFLPFFSFSFFPPFAHNTRQNFFPKAN